MQSTTLMPYPMDSIHVVTFTLISVFIHRKPMHRDLDEISIELLNKQDSDIQRLNRKGLSDKRSAVGFCLGSGLFGSYNSD